MTTALNALYVLASAGWDSYALMAFISASSLRRHHQDAKLTVLTDDLGAPGLTRSPLADVVDRFMVARAQEQDAKARSRRLKTTMRSQIRDGFVFLDVDTLVVSRLDGIWTGVSDLSAAPDRNRQNPEPHFPQWVAPLYAKLNWTCPLDRYFNTGVLAVRDTPRTHAFFVEWHRRWEATLAHGCALDQPSFNSALEATGVSCSEMPSGFNAMVDARPRLARHARVLHFYTERGEPMPGSVLAHVLGRLKATGKIEWSAIDQCARQGHPWAPPYQAYRLLQSGNVIRACAQKVRQLVFGTC